MNNLEYSIIKLFWQLRQAIIEEVIAVDQKLTD